MNTGVNIIQVAAKMCTFNIEHKVTWIIVSVMLFMLHLPSPCSGGIAPTWDYCECQWLAWEPWSQCTSDCFGHRFRTRKVQLRTHPGCDQFTDCASTDMGQDSMSCNDVCHNYGTKYGSYCSCVTGYQGQCCRTQINCGDPGQILNGQRHGTVFLYGSTVTYSCVQHYTLTDGSASRSCQLDGTWSGTQPRCAFSNTCGSNPCQNGGTCINDIERYSCTCVTGWSGNNCENDVQAPVITGCHSNITMHTTEAVEYVNWTLPDFKDPHGHTVTFSTNYPTHGYSFPWGDFKVQYVALKESNGLSTECKFDVLIRPTPCQDLNTPMNGALLCTNWKTDFGKLCRGYCQENYTTSPSVKADEWFVCGASGNWAPSNTMFECSYDALTNIERVSKPQTFGDCQSTSEVRRMKDDFVIDLKASKFGYFCSNYDDECFADNVKMHCI